MASPYFLPKNGQRLSWYEKYSTIDTDETDLGKMFKAVSETAITIAMVFGKPCCVNSKQTEWCVILQDSTRDINVQLNLLKKENGKFSLEVQRRSGNSFVFNDIYNIIKETFAVLIPITEKN